MKVALLTLEQKQSIEGQQYAIDCYFNPIQDKNDNWVISQQEMNACENEYLWVKELPLIEFKPIKINGLG